MIMRTGPPKSWFVIALQLVSEGRGGQQNKNDDCPEPHQEHAQPAYAVMGLAALPRCLSVNGQTPCEPLFDRRAPVRLGVYCALPPADRPIGGPETDSTDSPSCRHNA